jgi:hypothetical protein
MKRGTQITVGLLGVALAAITVALLALPAGAAPGGQDGDILPTPTLYPVEDEPYTLEVVGGADETLTFPAVEMDGFTLSETTVRSFYPNGMTFTMRPESENGDIQDVILFIQFVHGSGTRVKAEWDDDVGAYVAHPWSTGGRPAWSAFEFYWRVRDDTDASIDTEPHAVDYWDPDYEWFRAESDHMIIYWYGFGEDNPDAIAQKMANRMAALTPRWIEGFGATLSYTPIAVIYPDRDAMNRMYGEDGVANPRAAGFTSSDLGMSVQVLRAAGTPGVLSECIWAPEDPVAYWTMERRISTIYGTTGHEFTHLHQYALMGGMMGYEWWFEGQAEWFSNTSRQYDKRLRNLATLQDVPTLLTPIGSDLPQADGCYALSYLMGPSFINYLLSNYGGVETHGEIADLIRNQNQGVFEAIETVTGKPFLEVENEWRTYLGFPPLSLADIDPASALEEPVDPVAQEGDTVTLPAAPALSPVYEKPGPKSLVGGQCFANMQVTILRVGSLDGVDYYEVDCMGQIGWMTADQLTGE